MMGPAFPSLRLHGLSVSPSNNGEGGKKGEVGGGDARVGSPPVSTEHGGDALSFFFLSS